MQEDTLSADNVGWLRPQEPRLLPVCVSFREPVDGVGDDAGLLVLQREVRAVAVRQDNGQTQFLDQRGTAVAAWDSSVIDQIDWPDGVGFTPMTFRFGKAAPRSSWQSKLRKMRETRPNAYMRWEQEEDERLAAEFGDGKTVSEMADLHGRGESAVLSRLVKLSLVDTDRRVGPPRTSDSAWTGAESSS